VRRRGGKFALALAQWWAKNEWFPKRDEMAGTERRAIEEYEIVIGRRSDDAEPALLTLVQFALNEKAGMPVEEFELGPKRLKALATGPADRVTPEAVLGSIGGVGGEMRAACEEAIATQLEADSPVILRAVVAEAWVRFGAVLYDHEPTTDAAVELLAEFRQRFRDDPAPAVQRFVKQGRKLEEAARHEHRHVGRFRWTKLDSYADVRILGLGEHRLWGRKAWAATAGFIVVAFLLGLWPVSRRALELTGAAQEGRERGLETVSTIVFCVGAVVGGAVLLVRQAGHALHGEAVDWRALGIGLVLALALAGTIYAGGRITGLGE
jgi:hypothetical protein